MPMIEKPATIDILKRLVDTLINDMKEHSTGEKYYLDEISYITHDEFKEFDDILGREWKKNKEFIAAESVTSFHHRRLRAENGERIFCRLTLVGGTGYHVCINTEEKVII